VEAARIEPSLRCSRGLESACLDLQPFGPFEGHVEYDVDQCDHPQPQRVTKRPSQLGHMLEVHAVDARDDRRYYQDKNVVTSSKTESMIRNTMVAPAMILNTGPLVYLSMTSSSLVSFRRKMRMGVRKMALIV
jgi:hypothetical protein